MPVPFRNNLPVFTRWSKKKGGSLRKAYYDIAVSEGLLKIHFREEKQPTKEGNEESPWNSWLEFPIDSQFCKDLKLFLDEHSETHPSTKPTIVGKSKEEVNKSEN